MTPRDYILWKINELKNTDINVFLKYAYEKSTSFHIIEVTPESVRRGNETYIEWEYSIWKEFAELFPEEDLLISEEDETNDMSNLIYSYNSFGFKRAIRKTNVYFENDFGLLCGDEDYSLAA